MQPADILQLDRAVHTLIAQGVVREITEALALELEQTTLPFVGRSLPAESLPEALPGEIRSSWIFRLRGGVWSGCHYHPNSVQHMVAVDGTGLARVGGVERAIVPIDAPGVEAEQRWFVILAGVGHEFGPDGESLTVVSFHTCDAHELEEIDCASGSSRIYEPQQ
jgi:hypothetical protein